MEPRISYQVHGPSTLPTTESLAPTEKVVLGSIAFAVFWVLAVFPSVPCMPVGRTAGSLLGAMLMVIFRVMSPDEAYDAINLPILGLLFGTMVVSVYLERADMFKHLGKLLAWKSKGAKDLLCRICLISALSSAFFTNDTSCIVLTEFVLKFASQRKLNPRPFLLALASSANIGSSATPIGNPQNLVIAVQSKISFMSFVVGILPAMLVGILVNTSMLLCMYWRLLSIQKDIPAAEMSDISEKWKSTMKSANQPKSPVMNENTASFEIESQTVSSDAADSARYPGTDVSTQKKDGNESPKGVAEGKETLATRWKQIGRKSSAYIVAVGMLIAFLMGLNMSWTALTAALVLVALDFKDAMPALEKVSFSLLVFFCGMFISVDGFNRTGIPNALWNLMKPYAKVDHASGIAVLAIVIVVLSNLASNVPTVLLLGGKIAASAAAVSQADVKKSWLILAWVSTVAGNLSLLGSAANLIVCEQARRNPHLRYTLSFWNHLKFGVPSTIIVAAIGLTLIR